MSQFERTAMLDFLYLAAVSFSAPEMSWIELAKGGIGAVFSGLLIWLVVFQTPAFLRDMQAMAKTFAGTVNAVALQFRAEQDAARRAFKIEQEASREAQRQLHAASIAAFESALRAICDREERADERVMHLLERFSANKDTTAIAPTAVKRHD